MTLLFCIATGIILLKEASGKEAAESFLPMEQQAVLIIDPGHGGADGGAVAADGTKESELNLQISMKIKSLSDLLGIKSVIIRETEELPYPESAGTIAEKKVWDQHRRLQLINFYDEAVLISVHQNFYPDSRPAGPQVLYSDMPEAKALGEICHDLLNSNLCPQNRRVASPASDKIYLMKNAKCPAILVECGFLSNPSELQLLKDNTYQKKLAAIILASYIGLYCSG